MPVSNPYLFHDQHPPLLFREERPYKKEGADRGKEGNTQRVHLDHLDSLTKDSDSLLTDQLLGIEEK